MFKRIVACAICAAMASASSVQLAFAAAIADKTDLVAFNDFESGTSDWGPQGAAFQSRDVVTDEVTGNKYVELVQEATGNSYYLKKMEGMGSGIGPVVIGDGSLKIVGKARMNYISGGDSSKTDEFMEMSMTNNTGERLSLVRVAANNKLSVHRGVRNTTSSSQDTSNLSVVSSKYTYGTWVDAMYVIDVDENGDGTFTYYIDGSKYSLNGEKPFTLASMGDNTAIHAAFVLKSKNSTVTAAIDDVGIYAVPNDKLPEFTAALAETENIDPMGDITINFSNEIYKNGLNNMITVNGETVALSRMTVGNDQKSVTIAAPELGYPSSTEVSVAIDPTLTDVLGTAVTESALSFTTSDAHYETFYMTGVDAGNSAALPTANGSVEISFNGAYDTESINSILLLNGADSVERTVEQVDEDTVRVSYSKLSSNRDYTIDFSAVTSASGAALIQDGTYKFHTQASAAYVDETNRYTDFSEFEDGDVPAKVYSDRGLYFAERKNGDASNTVVETIGSKNYLWVSADATTGASSNDNNFGVAANAMFKYYDADLEYTAVFRFSPCEESGAQTRIRINNGDKNHANIVLFSEDAERAEGGRIGILGYYGEAGRNIVEDEAWTYDYFVDYTVKLRFADYGTAPKIYVSIEGTNSDSYECVVDVAESSFYTGGRGGEAVNVSNALNANSVYMYLNGSSGKVYNSICVSEFGLKSAAQETPVFEVSAPVLDVANGTAAVEIEYVNTYDTAKTLDVYIAQYDANGVVIGVEKASKSFAPSGEPVTASAQVNKKASRIAVFVWDAESLTPCADAVVQAL